MACRLDARGWQNHVGNEAIGKEAALASLDYPKLIGFIISYMEKACCHIQKQ